MYLFYISDISLNDSILVLPEEESKHVFKTLRLNKGDIIHVTDGRGLLCKCIISEVKAKHCNLEIVGKENKPSEKKYSVHIAAALTKNMNRMEFFIEKAVEIGLDKFTPLVCKRSERVRFNSERFVKIAVSALKQSQNLFLPEISEPVDFKSFIENHKSVEAQKFIAYQSDENVHIKNMCIPSKDVIVLIGPEGDFTDDEIQAAKQNGFICIGLGHNRLRTETAALYACFGINYQNI